MKRPKKCLLCKKKLKSPLVVSKNIYGDKKKSKDGSKNDFRLPTNTTKRGNGKRSKRGGKSMRGRSSAHRPGRV